MFFTMLPSLFTALQKIFPSFERKLYPKPARTLSSFAAHMQIDLIIRDLFITLPPQCVQLL